MRKTYKYRAYANKETLEYASEWLNLCRHLYNHGLEQRILAYKEDDYSLSAYEQIVMLPELKKQYPEYQFVGSQVLQDVLERLDKAYKAFFRRVKSGEKAGFPRFKGYNRYDSFTLKQTGWKLDGKYLHIRNIGVFKLHLSRELEGTIKTVTVKRSPTGNWYVLFSCDSVSAKKMESNDKSIGIDVGISSFLVDSDGNKVDNPKYFRKSERLLRARQRKLSRRIKGSNRRREARILVAKAHEKVTNQRGDFLHKLANHYIQNYGTIYIEDLNIKGMVKNPHLAKSIADSSWGQFFEFLSYKAEYAGRIVSKIPRFEPSSKRCNSCGAINHNLKLSDRQWVCESCGTFHDRDENASQNILAVGQAVQELTYASG